VNTRFYIFDKFKSLDIELLMLLRFARYNPLKLFDIVRNVVEDHVSVARDVRIHNACIDSHIDEVLADL